MKPNKAQCYELWKANNEYVEFMGEELDIHEAIALSRKQNALYLAWFDNDYSKLGV